MANVARVLCIHDLASIGRCSLSVAIPVISVMGHSVTPLATTLLSTHTGGFGKPASAPQTAFCVDALEHYQTLGEKFDCIYSGYLADESQIELVTKALAQSPNACYVLDPVMGDNGKMYSALSHQMPTAMKELAKKACVITPNVTESALLLGLDESTDIISEQMAIDRLNSLAELCKGDIVITGINLPNIGAFNACRAKNGDIKLIPFTKANGAYPGTGDLFASVLTGALLKNISFFKSVEIAADFVAKCVLSTMQAQTDARYGVIFEPLLTMLIDIGRN